MLQNLDWAKAITELLKEEELLNMLFGFDAKPSRKSANKPQNFTWSR